MLGVILFCAVKLRSEQREFVALLPSSALGGLIAQCNRVVRLGWRLFTIVM